VTSELDSKTQDKLYDNIFKEMERGCVLLITHSEKVLEKCSSKIELKNGRNINNVKEIHPG